MHGGFCSSGLIELRPCIAQDGERGNVKCQSGHRAEDEKYAIIKGVM